MKPPLGGGEKRDVQLDGELLDAAMQYGPSAGLPQIRKFLGDLQTQVHGRAPGNWAVSMGSGSQDLMSKVSQRASAAVLRWQRCGWSLPAKFCGAQQSGDQ